MLGSMKGKLLRSVATTALFAALNLAARSPHAQEANAAQETAEAGASQSGEIEEIIVTGSRIARENLTAGSPIYILGEGQIQLDRARTVEDIIAKLPLAGPGANATNETVGDGLGSSQIDLRSLGANRTLVLINGTRATPFNFRNKVDLNTIPATLIKRVEIMTGGGAAIYGADAVVGVVNFIMDDDFAGLEVAGSIETPSGGGDQFGTSITAGTEFGDERGHITGYLEFTERRKLLAGKREFTESTQTLIPSEGGNFTDVASGNFFAFDEEGNFETARQLTDVTPERFLIQPLKRVSGGAFFNYELFEDLVEVYGRAMFTDLRVRGPGNTGQTPISVNEVVSISESNPFLPEQAAELLTFDEDGNAEVQVERSLGLGLQEFRTTRQTVQVLGGLQIHFTDAVSGDFYIQYGRTDEDSIVRNNALRNDPNGNSRFANVADMVDIFGPDAEFGFFTETLPDLLREREQTVISPILVGDSSDLFSLPAGPISFAMGYEYREEIASQIPAVPLRTGNTFGLGGFALFERGRFGTNEFFGEWLAPIVKGLPFVEEFTVEGAFRTTDFEGSSSAFDGRGPSLTFDANKVGFNWLVDENLRIRGARQVTVRAPTFNEFASPEVVLSLSLFDPDSPDFVPRLGGRFDGDPCLDGRGDPAQCARFGAPTGPVEFDTRDAIFTFGGNPDIRPERGETFTLGVVFTPEFLPEAGAGSLGMTVDFYDIKISDAIGVIQPILSLTSCFINNPDRDNPLCEFIERDPETGLINRTVVNEVNIAQIKQQGLDIGFTYQAPLPKRFGQLQLGYQSNIVTQHTRQDSPAVPPTECKGTIGSNCTGDFTSFAQPDFQQRVTLDWLGEVGDFPGSFHVQVGWRRLGSLSAVNNPSERVSAQNYFDFVSTWAFKERFELTFGVDNLFDEDPPLISSGSLFGTSSVFDVIGTSVGLSLRVRN